jgi:mRNA-degrading endonuclease RelE of RelBE toxin-antitoxin system
MTYNVVLSPQAKKFLQKQDTHIQSRLRKGLATLCNPFSVLEHFEGNYYKLRIGDYRALCDVEEKTVIVRVLENRGRMYK